jgi:hypothetical protein
MRVAPPVSHGELQKERLREQAFCFSYRKDMKDADRFSLAVSQIMGKHLTWNQVTGKEGDPRQYAE